MENHSRSCPKCSKELTYKTKGNLNWAIKLERLCKTCSFTGKVGKYERTEDIKSRIGNRNKDKPKIWKDPEGRIEKLKGERGLKFTKEEQKNKRIEYNIKNKDSIRIYSEGRRILYPNYHKENFIKNKDKIYYKRKERYKNDPLFRLKNTIRFHVNRSLKKRNYSKLLKTKDVLGCLFEEFFVYLESKFKPWMTWDNYGKYNGELDYGWDLDHIIPISSARNEEDIYRLNHFSNFQPLCSKINRDIKRDKLNY